MRKKKAPAGQGRAPQKIRQPDYTPSQLAEQLLRAFRGRENRVAASTTQGFAPEPGPLTAARVANEHLTTRRCFAFYPMRVDNTVRVSCVDFDDKPQRPDSDIRRKVRALATALKKHGVHTLVEQSQGGRGFHVWIFFKKSQPACLVRSFWRGLAASCGVPVREIFPAQDELSGKGFGNPIRYPLYGKSCFVDVGDWSQIDPLAALKNIAPVTTVTLTEISRTLGFGLDHQPVPKRLPIGSNLSDPELSSRVRTLLSDPSCLLAKRWRGDTVGMNDTSRSAIASAIACCLVHRYVPTPEIEAALRMWCLNNRYEKGSRPDWIQRVMTSAYELAWRNDSTRRNSAGRSPCMQRAQRQAVIRRRSSGGNVSGS